MTHWDELNVEACVLWCCAIRKAVLDAELDVRPGLGRLAVDRRAYWEARINEAETQPPRAFEHGNGFVTGPFQHPPQASAVIGSVAVIYDGLHVIGKPDFT